MLSQELFGALSQRLPLDSKEKLSEALKEALKVASQRFALWLEALSVGSQGTYGGNTSCILLKSEGATVILDAGTGIRLAGQELLQGVFGEGRGEALLLLSHTHIDHIVGWPFFTPAYVRGNAFEIWGPPMRDAIEEKSLEEVFQSIMQWYFFPVFLEDMGASFSFKDLGRGKHYYRGLAISATPMYHPVWCLGYRIECGEKIVVYQTDSEVYPEDPALPETQDAARIYNEAAVELALGADVLVCDAQYLPEEYEPEKFGQSGRSKKGWGHSTYEQAVERAAKAQVKKLVLYHHEPEHNDAFLDLKVERARAYAKERGFSGEVVGAYEGLVIRL